MFRTMMALMSVAVFAGIHAPAQAQDQECAGCAKIAQGEDGFCCGKGKAFGVEVTSEKLYDALVGSKADLDSSPCPGCRHAGKTDGKCEQCKTYVVDGLVYHSPVAYALAKGKPVAEEKMKTWGKQCGGCKTAYAESGWCEHCHLGFVAHRLFKNEEDYAAALAAYQTLVKAAKTAPHCEGCAVAMVTNGACDRCHVTFKDGKVADKG